MAENQLAADLSYANYWDMIVRHSECFSAETSFADLATSIVAATQSDYEAWIEEALGGAAETGPEQADFIHAVGRFAPADLDELLTADNVVKAGLAMIELMGFDLDRIPIRTEQVGHNIPSMAIAVAIPSDVRLLVGRTQGLRGLEQFAREMGRALHHAHIFQNHYMLRGLNGTVLETTAQVFRHVVTSEIGLAVPELADQQLEGLNRYNRLSNAMHTRIFLTLCSFQREIYNNPQVRLQRRHGNRSTASISV